MSIRLRLALWYAGLLGAILIALSLGLYLTLSRVLLDEVDSRLRLTASQIHMAVGAAGDGEDTRSLAETAINIPVASGFAAPGLSIQVLDDRGRIVTSSPSLRNEQLPIDPTLISNGLRGGQSLTTLTAGGRERVRVLTMPLIVNARVLGIVQVGQSLHDLNQASDRLGLLLGIGGIATTVLAGIGGWFSARRGLSPIDQIAETAQSIGQTGDFGRRIRSKVANDEVGRLAGAFNDMIGRIEAAFESQKQFVADSSHELRTPLTVIRGNLDLLKRDLSDRDRKECLEAIEGEAERMSRIVSDLLLLAQLDAEQQFDRRPVELDTLLLDVFREAKHLAQGRKVLLGHEDSAIVLGDADRLKQALLNLVDNATKYSPPGATITLALTKSDGWVTVDVADTGVGIPREELAKIFDRFYRVDKARSRAVGGTGLGLTIVRQIVEAHGGKVTVSSAPGQGSTFSVRLPTV